MKPVFALCGEAGAGKDTAAKALVPHEFVLTGFAQPLKALCSWVFGWDEFRLSELAYKEAPSNHSPFTTDGLGRVIRELMFNQFSDRLHERNFTGEVSALLYQVFSEIKPDWTRRRILQQVGTNGFRAIDVNHWAERGVAAVKGILASQHVAGVALTDLRFVNEADAIRRHFPVSGRVIRVERLDGPRGTESSAHVSEQEWSQIWPDYVFVARFGETERLQNQMMMAWAEVMEGES